MSTLSFTHSLAVHGEPAVAVAARNAYVLHPLPCALRVTVVPAQNTMGAAVGTVYGRHVNSSHPRVSTQ